MVMTERATLEALLARVMEGEGWDAKLNADIAVTLGEWQRKWHDSERPHGWYWRRGDHSWTAEGDGYPADYLGSLDAALTLVPEGWRINLLSEWDNETLRAKGAWQAILMPIGKGDSIHAGMRTRCDHAATPPRALIAACIKVRIASHG